jgi:cation diffusion facilitator CzcD-associated flavoprotein CzcO
MNNTSINDISTQQAGMSESGKQSTGPRFLIIGAGMAGILAAIKLQEAGYTNMRVYEKASELGGTWRENIYPGVACDVPSQLYSYSFAPNPEWSHFFSPGNEIEAYLKDVAARFDVMKYIQFDAEVTRLEYKDGRWYLQTEGDIKDVGDFVIAATGVLHHPSYPDIKGMDDFDGISFHSARWDNTVSLTDKRIGIIGTGSTAVQIASALGGNVKELSVFQRTAQWILKVENPSIDENDKKRYRENPDELRGLHDSLSRWFSDNFANAVVDADSEMVKLMEKLCAQNLEENVYDPVLREKLRPNYRAACKRLVISPNFYEAIQRPGVNLITSKIDRIEKNGIRTSDGELHELDVIVYATGFHVDAFMRPMAGFGRDGVSLADVWHDRPSAYLSISIPDFPNLFMLNGPNGPVGNFSLIEVAELQFDYIMQLVDQVLSGKCREVSATKEALDKFDDDRIEAAKNTVWVTGCHSWYLDDRGIPAAWPWTFDRFREEMAAPKLSDYERV